MGEANKSQFPRRSPWLSLQGQEGVCTDTADTMLLSLWGHQGGGGGVANALGNGIRVVAWLPKEREVREPSLKNPPSSHRPWMSSSTSRGHHQALSSLAALASCRPCEDGGLRARDAADAGDPAPDDLLRRQAFTPSFRGDHWGAHWQRRLPPLFPHTNGAVSPLIMQEELGSRHKTAVLLSERNRWTEGKGKKMTITT